jgi:hypothetical protein
MGKARSTRGSFTTARLRDSLRGECHERHLLAKMATAKLGRAAAQAVSISLARTDDRWRSTGGRIRALDRDNGDVLHDEITTIDHALTHLGPSTRCICACAMVDGSRTTVTNTMLMW